MVGEPRQRALDEGGDGRRALVVEELAVGQAAVVVHDGVKEVVAEPGDLVGVRAGAIAGDDVTGAQKARVALTSMCSRSPGQGHS